MKVVVSCISIIYSEEETIHKIDQSIADYIHVDIMDGKFVKNKNYCYQDIKKWVNNVSKPLDIHLMVNDPLTYIKDYVNLKPKFISIHYEATDNILEIINYLHQNNIMVGIAINPETTISVLTPYLD